MSISNSVLITSNGTELAVSNTSTGTANDKALLIAGSDGTTNRLITLDSSGRQVAVGAGTAGTPAGGVITIQGVSGGVVVPVSGTITANQGTANTLSNRWPTIITDGVNVTTIKAASTAAVATDPALVVAISPNNTIVVTTANTQSSTIELNYDDSVAVAGAQAGYFYKGLVYTVPSSYVFNCVQFNSFSSDNRVTARVSKIINGGSYNLGTNTFTSGSSYTSPLFGAYLEVEVTTVIGGTNDVTLTATYTNQDGVGSRTATCLIKKNTPVGFKVIFILQSGDYGIISVQNITRSTANTGILNVNIGVEFYNQAMVTASQNYILASGTQSLIVKSGELVELAWSSNAAATSERVIKVVGILTPS